MRNERRLKPLETKKLLFTYSVEYPNMEAFGRFMNALMTDSEWLRLGESALARDFSARLLGQSLDTEVAV